MFHPILSSSSNSGTNFEVFFHCATEASDATLDFVSFDAGRTSFRKLPQERLFHEMFSTCFLCSSFFSFSVSLCFFMFCFIFLTNTFLEIIWIGYGYVSVGSEEWGRHGRQSVHSNGRPHPHCIRVPTLQQK